MTTASEPKQTTPQHESTSEHGEGSHGAAHGQAKAQFTNVGAIPPVAQAADGPPAPPSASDRAFGHVTASGLNVRSSPVKAENIVGALHYGDKVETVGRDGAWLKIEHPGGQAFVHGAFVHVDGVGPAAPHDATAQHETHAPAPAHHDVATQAPHDATAAPAPHATTPAAPTHDAATAAPGGHATTTPHGVTAAPAPHATTPAAPTHDAPTTTPTPHTTTPAPPVAQTTTPPGPTHEAPATPTPAPHATTPTHDAPATAAPPAHTTAPTAPPHDTPATAAPVHAPTPAPQQHATTHATAHHEVAAPHAETAKPAVDPAVVRGQYQTLLMMVENGFLPLDVAIQQLIAFDRGLHGGQMSPTGIELVANFPIAVVQNQLAKKSEHAPADQSRSAPTHAAASTTPPKADVDHHATTATPTTPHIEAPPAAKEAPADTTWVPPAGSHLTDPHLLGLAAKIHDARMQPLLVNIGGMLQESSLAKKQTDVGNNMEYTDATHRDALVRSIGVVRSELEALDGNDPNVAAFKLAVYHEVERISPYHFQKNIRAIETWDKAKDKGGKRQWTTCNLTSLAMCLEVVGINSRNFPAEHEHLLEEVARLFEGDINSGKDDQGDYYQGAVLTAKGKGTSLDKVRGFRLPDFLELAAVVYGTIAGGYAHDEKGIIAGANDAANQKGQIPFLKGLAKFMGGTATGVNLKFDADAKKNTAITNELETYGSKHRGIYTDGVEKMNTQRNLMENAEQKQNAATTDKEKAKHQKEHAAAEAYYTKLDKSQHQWLDDPAIEKTLPIETYKNAVTSQLGKHLDAGKGVIAGLSGHYVRLYEVTDTGVCVQDPGQWNRTEMRITWAEARAMGYFWVNLVISS